MTTVYHLRLQDRFIEIKSTFRRNKLHGTNQSFSFLGGNFNSRGNVRAPVQFRREIQPQHLIDNFSSRTGTSIFNSTAPVLLVRSNETNTVFPALKSTSHFLSQSTVSHRSDSSSVASCTYCQKADKWLPLESRVVSSS